MTFFTERVFGQVFLRVEHCRDCLHSEAENEGFRCTLVDLYSEGLEGLPLYCPKMEASNDVLSSV